MPVPAAAAPSYFMVEAIRTRPVSWEPEAWVVVSVELPWPVPSPVAAAAAVVPVGVGGQLLDAGVLAVAVAGRQHHAASSAGCVLAPADGCCWRATA